MEKNKTEIKILQKNKKAYFNYEIIEDFECGLALQGTEVKSLRQGKFSFSDSYAKLINGELWLIGLTIQPYVQGNIFNHTPDRNRRILIHKQEIKHIRRKVEERGFTLVPTKIYLKGNLIKIQISLCRGKMLHDKKNTIKQRDLDRQSKRDVKDYYK